MVQVLQLRVGGGDGEFCMLNIVLQPNPSIYTSGNYVSSDFAALRQYAYTNTYKTQLYFEFYGDCILQQQRVCVILPILIHSTTA